ncbi:MAG: TonB-dependent receptor [Hyphomonadaceae bacterium]|nr:TonB-dependent receptor [Hyphomonadaceae bacterium]
MAQRSMRAALARLGFGASLIALTTAFAETAMAQQTPTPPPAEDGGEVVTITGFRGSLAAAIETKREETGIVDAITAEDIADFPDLNLAESLQRVPGVQIDRDGGEGRTINVRGLSSDFVRVRLNGLEALATTGGRDGRQNRNRAFDFNVFASELFNSIKVSKSQSAETEEGSLGATVDLTTARPFDYAGFTMAAGVQGSYNDLAQNTDPRATFLVSDRWLDGKLGALFSVAYTKRNTIEEGSSSGRFRIPTADGCTSTPPNTGTAVGANRCYQTISGPIETPNGTLTGAAAALAANNAAHPRIPRYGRISYDRERIGSTFTLQFQPFESTKFTYDLLYADLKETRHEEFLEAISFAREANAPGLRATDLLTGRIDNNNTLVAGTFNDVDIRVEQRRDNLETEFFQNAFKVEHEFSDRLRGEFLAGHTRAVQYNPNQTTLSFERYDVDGYSYDYSDKNLPAFNYGFDVTNPASYQFSAANTLGDPSLIRMRPNKAINTFETFAGDLEYDLNDWLTLKGGASQKTFNFRGYEERRANPEPLPASVLAALAAQGITINQYATSVTGFGKNMDLPAGTPTTWVVPSIDALLGIIDFECDCVNAFGDFRVDATNNLGENRSAEEQSTGAYVQADFDTDIAGARVRANVGLRYVETELTSTGFTNLGAGFVPLSVTNSYEDTLPSFNLSIEPTDGFIVRVAASKVLARPTLPALTPGGTVDTSPPTFSINAGNPFLEPIRANTYDLSIEWYPYDEALFAVAFFAKDIDTFVQRLRTLMPYNESGYPDSLLPAGVSNTELFDVNSFVNTPGGEVTGFEVSAQTPFTFLPGFLSNFGGQLSYTEIQSQISYVLNTSLSVVTPFVKAPIIGQSPRSLSATIYYADGPFEARLSSVYRDEYLTLVPAASGNDVEGKAETLNLDFSASYEINDNFSLSFEAINLTDQYDERWINSVRKNSNNYEHTGREFVVGVRYKY